MSKNLLKSVICFAIAAVFALSGVSFADDSFEFHGYMRSGFSLNEKLNKPQGSIGAPFSGKSFRLGNEQSNTYIENEFVKAWKDDDGTFFKAHFMYMWSTTEDNPWGNDGNVSDTNSDGNYDAGAGNQARVRQAYVEGGGFEMNKDMKVWAGLRYYSREDIHITDWYYRDLTAYGFGVETIKLGFADFNFAWLNATNTGTQLYDGDKQIGSKTTHGFDFQLNEIKLPGGALNVNVRIDRQTGGDTAADGSTESKAGTGYFTELSYNLASFLGIGKGFFKTVYQYGKGISAGGYNGGWIGNLGSFGQTQYTNADTEKKSQAHRLYLWGVYELSENTSILPMIAYCMNMKNEDIGMDDSTSLLEAGFRLKQSLNRNLAINAEYGYIQASYKNSGNDVSPAIHKLTIAPTFTFDTGFWTRPEIRIYGTYAFWNDDMKGSVGARENADDTSAMQFGFQAEAWW
jgi:maltoporin